MPRRDLASIWPAGFIVNSLGWFSSETLHIAAIVWGLSLLSLAMAPLPGMPRSFRETCAAAGLVFILLVELVFRS